MGKDLSEMSLKELWELFPISLVEPDKRWGMFYSEIESDLKILLSDFKIERISHIGSTAVSGIWAKNIVDVLIEASRDSELKKIAEKIEDNGFIRMSERADRISFNYGYTSAGFSDKVFHVHLRYVGDHDELYFRDYLNEHKQTAKEYERLKLRLRKKFEHDRDAYTNAKTEFVEKVTFEAKKAYKGRYESIVIPFGYGISKMYETEKRKMNYSELFHCLHPGFFEEESIRALPEKLIFTELVMDFRKRSPDVTKPVLNGITFGEYHGALSALQNAVCQVDEDWVRYFKEGDRFYCAFDGGRIVAFCGLSDMGRFRELRIGGPGCVGTIPEYRGRGIGLEMVRLATETIRRDGFDLSWIHYTHLENWYAKLGYRPILRWNSGGILWESE